MQGADTARGPSASGADLSVGAVLSAEKDTKKLNAGIAIIALQNIHEQGGLSEDQLLTATSLSERLTKTALYKYDGEDQNQAGIQQAFALIEEYLKEQGV